MCPSRDYPAPPTSRTQARGDPWSRKCRRLRARSQLAAAADGAARQGRRGGGGAGNAPTQRPVAAGVIDRLEDERGDEATCRRRRRIRLSMKRKLSDADNFIWQVDENPPADETQIGEHRGPCAIDYDS
ncbi:hypothetical protein Y032_0433g1374 [Ancylostoma ceylanicum]|uniref:Uncharacterized protein n=1 Tax=Ancylostoma ceylanicum TaxID=53326 RepID=A0A016X095_9BILA|nr:hypothetical protein Y032_0433g1374 [Ancylostoma ceylanicum]